MLNVVKLLKDIFADLAREEAHRREMMSPQEAKAYNRWLADQACAPRIGATIPCPVDLKEIDARTSRPPTPTVV